MIVHEPYWTAAARHADIVLPATITLERDDIGAAGSDDRTWSRCTGSSSRSGRRSDDYAIFAGLAARLGCETAFTEGRSADEWLRQHV